MRNLNHICLFFLIATMATAAAAVAAARDDPGEEVLELEAELEPELDQDLEKPLNKSYLCTDRGCTGQPSAMIRYLRTISSGTEQIILHTAVADSLRTAGACPGWTGTGIDVDGNGRDQIMNKVHIAYALDKNIYLRVASSSNGSLCHIYYVNLRTP